MRKFLTGIVFTLVIGLLPSQMAYAEDVQAAHWAENNPVVAIYNDPLGLNIYEVDYNNIPTEEISTQNNIRLLMVDGGFVPHPEMIMENGRILAPIKVFAQTFDASVAYNKNGNTVTIKTKDTEIKIVIGSHEALVNGTAKTLDCPAKAVENEAYVPLRFTAEALGATVQYIPTLTYGHKIDDNTPGWILFKEKVSVVSIEKAVPHEKVFTAEEGLAEVKKLSAKTYERLLVSLKEIGNSFSETQKDYDSQAIIYTNQDMGRYYVYKLTGFESNPILFNKYTGEIFSEKAGLPFVNIEGGFINISWMYQ